MNNPGPVTVDLQALADSRAQEIQQALSGRILRRPLDSEKRKILAKIYTAIRWAQEIDGRGELGTQCDMVLRLLAADPTKLGLDALLSLMDVWDRTLIETRDDTYVRTLLRAELVRDRLPKTTVMTWSNVFPEGDRARWEGLLSPESKETFDLEQGATQLLELYRTRINQYELERARDVMSSHVLWEASIAVEILVASLIIVLSFANPVLTSAAAGALGGAISGTRHVRATPRRIGALRALRPLAFLQPLIGAAAGLVVYLAISAGTESVLNPSLLQENKWAVFGIAAFAIGYSEPKFIRVIDRLSDALLGKPEDQSKPPPDAAGPGIP